MASQDSFGKRLFELRKRQLMTQRELAEAMDVDFTYVSKIENGSAPPPARDRIELAATALGLSSTETAELFSLAEKIPSDVMTFFSQQPTAIRLYRSIRKSPAAEQEELLQRLIRDVEKRQRKGKAGDD